MVAAPPPWGHHLHLDAAGCDRLMVTDPDMLRRWVGDLVDCIGMTAFGPPDLDHFGEGAAMTGWTVAQKITTSNINAHFMDTSGDLFLDVFSCKPFDPQVVLDHTTRWLRPQAIGWLMLERRAGLLPDVTGGGVRVVGAELASR
jgi:hypothetical protein